MCKKQPCCFVFISAILFIVMFSLNLMNSLLCRELATKYDKYDNWDASSIHSKIESERNKILNNARAEVKKLQAKYKNYDNVGISVQVNIDENYDY